MTCCFEPCTNVHAAIDRDFVILLDLRRNRYWAAPEQAFTSEAGGARVVEAALRARLVQRAASARPPESWPRCVRSGAEIHLAEDVPPATLNGVDAFNVLQACAWAQLILATKRLDWAQAAMARLRARCVNTSLNGQLAMFEAFRALWPRARVCLFDSLALSRFLLAAGIDAQIVFGVRAGPFSAHCWVEADGAVVNDRTGQFASYQPICRI